VTAIVRHENCGLMTRRTAKAQHAEMEVLKAEAAKVDWMYKPAFSPRCCRGSRNG